MRNDKHAKRNRMILLAGAAVLLMALAAAAWAASPADKDYAAAQNALGEDDFNAAAGMFSRFYREHADDGRAGSALYWEAYARYREGGRKQLTKARSVLRKLESRFPDSVESEDAAELMLRIEGALARSGDPDAARAVTEAARSEIDQKADTRLAALNALVMMDEDKAVPILEKILANRSPKNIDIRRRAVMLAIAIDDERTAPILLDVIRNDPDPEIRANAAMAITHLSGAEAVKISRELIEQDQPPRVMKRLLLGLGEADDPEAGELLMEIAGDEDRDPDVRGIALLALGDREEPRTMKYLQRVFEQSDDEDIQQKALVALSRFGDDKDLQSWFMAQVKDSNNSIDTRKMCLFWAVESENLDVAEIRSLYDEADDPELRKQVIFAVSELDSDAGVDLLIDIARNDPSPDMRQMAIFWLGDSGDDRALEYLEELLSEE